MAGDTCVTNNGTRVGNEPKVFNINGYLVGAAGDAGMAEEFLDFMRSTLKKGCSLPKCEDFSKGKEPGSLLEAFVVAPRGKIFKYENNCLPRQRRAPFVALGSGRDLAMGAMAAGASAKQAINIAIKYDTATGGKVETVFL